MTNDYIEEGWVRFRRVPCKEGHIDVWMGDAACNPNDEERPYYNLNSFATYLRCNGSKWIHVRDLKHNGRYLPYLDMASEFTADEIWAELTFKSEYCSCDNGIIICPGCEGDKRSEFGICAGCDGIGEVVCGKCNGNTN